MLEAELLALVQRMTIDTYELLVLVAEWDIRGHWAATGALSCAAWLAQLSDIEVCTARTQVRVAHALRKYPALDLAMARGDISYAKAKVLVAHLNDDNAAALVGIAERTPAGRLGAAVAAWSRRNEDCEVIDQRHNEERSVTWRTDPDGMVTLTARMTPEAAAGVCAAIETKVMRSQRAPAGASLAQQRHDALHAAISGAGGGVTAEVVIHVREDGTSLTDGTPISDHAVAGLLPEAFVSLLIHDAQRQPIDASPRRRSPTRRQRRVLDERHPECTHPGCHARVFLEYDQLVRYADGGLTVLDGLDRKCGHHNRARETGVA